MWIVDLGQLLEEETMKPEQSDKHVKRKVAKGGKWTVSLDDYGYPRAIVIDGWDVLHLVPSARTGACADDVVKLLNARKP